MRVVIIANPTAGRGRTRALVEGYARAIRGDVDIRWTQEPLHAVELARAAAPSCDVVCAVGGDGTVSEVVNGLMPHPVPIVIVPTGSGNDFASLIACPRNAAELARVLEDGVGLRMDVLDCGDRYCVNSIGIGFEAMVTYHSLAIRRLRGLPLYLTAVIKALAGCESIPYTLSIDGAPAAAGDFLMVSVGNGVRAGGGFRLHPAAYPDDGRMDVCVVRRMSRVRMLSVLPLTLRGAHVRRRGISVFGGARVRVAASRPFPVHIDGEYLGRREEPLDLSVVPRCLPVLLRREGRARHAGPVEPLVAGSAARDRRD